VRFIVDNIGGITGGMKSRSAGRVIRHGVRTAQLGRNPGPRGPLPL
jgi:hypothetical protein